MTALDRVAPYVEELLENHDVQGNVQRSVTRARQAYTGARGKKDAKRAITDRRVRLRLGQSAAAARNAAVAIRRAPVQRQRARRRRLLLVLALVAGAGSLTVSEQVRLRVAGWLRAGSSSDPRADPERGKTPESKAGPQPVANAGSSSTQQ